jgi:hypothetical protein
MNYNQLVDELLTTCHPHSAIDKEVPKTISKPNSLYFLPPSDQRLSTEEAKYSHEELGAYCNFKERVLVNVGPKETDLTRLIPSFVQSDSRVSEIFLGASRGDSAFMRLNVSDELGFPKMWNSFGLMYESRPPAIQNEVKMDMKEEVESKGEVQNEQSAIKNLIKQKCFYSKPKKARKRRKIEGDE